MRSEQDRKGAGRRQHAARERANERRANERRDGQYEQDASRPNRQGAPPERRQEFRGARAAAPHHERPPGHVEPYEPRERYEPFEPGHPREEGASFGAGPPPRYLGTGFMGRGGPGYAGGYYGFGTGSPEPDWRAGRRYPPGPKGYQRSDERLREDISERLLQAHTIESSDVTVEVSGAKVMLAGTVPERRMKHAIEDLVDACPGVQDIENRIRVRR